MTQDLTTLDTFQQLESRVTRVENDLRAFRTEVSMERSDKLFLQIMARFDQQQRLFDGLFFVTWITVLGSIWLKP